MGSMILLIGSSLVGLETKNRKEREATALFEQEYAMSNFARIEHTILAEVKTTQEPVQEDKSNPGRIFVISFLSSFIGGMVFLSMQPRR